ncbi:isochorismatase family protein [Nocardiopsis dassonvillei]|uniref:Isochorismatase n=1 Tax=Nocardiopsis dassonvillei (strain ATCC 23218 / DSM 43111 / CIP 107115 / JCM 7437 / KCTC 9190 / NBRC 14626 / NCTC 10488 / NRRL B-5397 / IMRU 509) TaxID=446468 RepID=D7B179_NOCDD|nr:isochorismatase family protein [Nocardiopsis dassonvillei]ADH66470.1 Isochorismatase [Nocardiopsis dassonvillei subsp. dassonvillei DSM 43111]NKY77791.1 isochorismatase family protein [Nocardiopsis dassonvillei]VEI92491.1 Isochorismatase [Nocardiopsis dassonvillei]
MSLPAIEPYPMPGEGDLPDNRMSWSVDPDRCVLLIHDMQRYFLDAFSPDEEPVPSLIANVGALRSACAALGVPRVYTAQPGSQDPDDRGLLTDLWGEGLRDDPAHTAIVEGLEPADDEIVMTKWRYSAFARSGLEEYLRDAGRDQLVVCGVYAHIGVLTTACDAFMRDVQAFVVADAVADFSAGDHAMALSYAARRCAGTVSTKGVLAALNG